MKIGDVLSLFKPHHSQSLSFNLLFCLNILKLIDYLISLCIFHDCFAFPGVFRDGVGGCGCYHGELLLLSRAHRQEPANLHSVLHPP